MYGLHIHFRVYFTSIQSKKTTKAPNLEFWVLFFFNNLKDWKIISRNGLPFFVTGQHQLLIFFPLMVSQGTLLGYTCEGLARAEPPGAQSPWLLGGE